MTNRYCRHVLWLSLLASAVGGAYGEPTRVAVIDADGTDGGQRRIGIEALPGIEILRLPVGASVESLSFAATMIQGQPSLPLHLAASGAIGSIAVFYPDIGEPYRSVFSKIIEGIEERTKVKVASFAIGNNFNAQDISGELKRQEIKVVIALGRNGLKAANGLDKEIGVVAGGVVSVPEAESKPAAILSLAPDPALLFGRLKSMLPRIQRVFVAYDSRQNGWLIKLARDAAKIHNIELVAQEAGDLKSALGLYQTFFGGADPKRDALWLPQDSATVDESTVLPLVLQESWAKGITVFSSSVSHVKRGALFALYPNNTELGRNLAVSALGIAAGTPAPKGVLPLREVLTAFNTRTASHLGLSLSAAQQQAFDLLFPEQ